MTFIEKFKKYATEISSADMPKGIEPFSLKVHVVVPSEIRHTSVTIREIYAGMKQDMMGMFIHGAWAFADPIQSKIPFEGNEIGQGLGDNYALFLSPGMYDKHKDHGMENAVELPIDDEKSCYINLSNLVYSVDMSETPDLVQAHIRIFDKNSSKA